MRSGATASGIQIRRDSGLPVYRQLVDQLRYLIGAGRYPANGYLPTMRALADELGLNLNTVNRAYQQLQRDGLIRSTPGKGALVVAPSGAGLAHALESPARPEEVDAILAAAIERALSAGLTGAELSSRISALLEEAVQRVPPPPRFRVLAGPAWRGRVLASRLGALTGIETVSGAETDPDADRVEVLVVPRYGAWRPDDPARDGEPTVELAVLPSREAARALVDLDAGSAICAVAGDEGVARWLLDTATTLAGPSAARVAVAADAGEVSLGDSEWVIYETGIPGAERLEASGRSIGVEPAFPPTAVGALEAALAAARGRAR